MVSRMGTFGCSSSGRAGLPKRSPPWLVPGASFICERQSFGCEFEQIGESGLGVSAPHLAEDPRPVSLPQRRLDEPTAQVPLGFRIPGDELIGEIVVARRAWQAEHAGTGN